MLFKSWGGYRGGTSNAERVPCSNPEAHRGDLQRNKVPGPLCGVNIKRTELSNQIPSFLEALECGENIFKERKLQNNRA